jgi:CRISPR-associated protein (TIGR03984 family)
MSDQHKNLYSSKMDTISLLEALRSCADRFGSAQGLFYSPISCIFGKVAGSQVIGGDGKDLELEGVFEARIFNDHGELRWLNELEGKGRAVLISGGEINEGLKDTTVIDVICQQYLLWGEGTGEAAIDGWSWLSAARIGKRAVPISDVGKKDRVQLKVLEYLSVNDSHGNVVVSEERLLGFEVQKWIELKQSGEET